jgi:hypothetical protein
MNRPMRLLWFEGMDPQCLPPSLALFASHGCDLQREPVSLSEARLARVSVQYSQQEEKEEEEEEEPLSSEDTYLILKRLRELGYLD